jgi:PKD repeat protein
MKRLICLLIALGIVVSTAGCVNPMLGLVSVLEENNVVSFFEDIERVVPPPKILAPYFSSRQEVPLNNIPNADMENWIVPIVQTGPGSSKYSGDSFYTGGSSLLLQAMGRSSCKFANDYEQSARFPNFVLQHNYVSFYIRGFSTTTGGGAVYSAGRYYYHTNPIQFSIYDETGVLINTRQVGSINGGFTPTSRYAKGTRAGDDGKSWTLLVMPIPEYYVGKLISMQFTAIQPCNVRTGLGGVPCNTYYMYPACNVYIDNIYYSTSDGSEIYLLEAPTAQFTYVVNGYDVVVDANISQTSGTLYSLKWTWGDGAYSEGVTATHKYAFPGNKQITLKIMNNENLVDTATLTVSVDGTSYYAGPQGSNTANLPPIAGFSYGLTGMTIAVDGSYSKDDGTITLYSWDFDGVKKNGITATHTYANSGSKTVTLIVKDNYGLESERKITFDLPIGGVTSDTTVVDNPGTPPTAKFSYTLTAPTVTVDASESSDDVKIEKYEWDWGDGSTSVGKTQTHTYSDMGTTRTITLTVTDDEGFTASSSATVQTISYNEPVDSNTTTYVAPPTTSGTSTPVPSGGNTNTAFPVWGLIVFLAIVGGFVLLILGLTGKVKLKGKGKRRKRK